MKNNILKYALLAMAFVMFTLPAMAAPGDPPVDDDPVEPTPIDNWMMILMMAAIALGAYLIIRHNRKTIA